jgi:hypothetical protein
MEYKAVAERTPEDDVRGTSKLVNAGVPHMLSLADRGDQEAIRGMTAVESAVQSYITKPMGGLAGTAEPGLTREGAEDVYQSEAARIGDIYSARRAYFERHPEELTPERQQSLERISKIAAEAGDVRERATVPELAKATLGKSIEQSPVGMFADLEDVSGTLAESRQQLSPTQEAITEIPAQIIGFASFGKAMKPFHYLMKGVGQAVPALGKIGGKVVGAEKNAAEAAVRIEKTYNQLRDAIPKTIADRMGVPVEQVPAWRIKGMNQGLKRARSAYLNYLAAKKAASRAAQAVPAGGAFIGAEMATHGQMGMMQPGGEVAALAAEFGIGMDDLPEATPTIVKDFMGMMAEAQVPSAMAIPMAFSMAGGLPITGKPFRAMGSPPPPKVAEGALPGAPPPPRAGEVLPSGKKAYGEGPTATTYEATPAMMEAATRGEVPTTALPKAPFGVRFKGTGEIARVGVEIDEVTKQKLASGQATSKDLFNIASKSNEVMEFGKDKTISLPDIANPTIRRAAREDITRRTEAGRRSPEDTQLEVILNAYEEIISRQLKAPKGATVGGKLVDPSLIEPGVIEYLRNVAGRVNADGTAPHEATAAARNLLWIKLHQRGRGRGRPPKEEPTTAAEREITTIIEETTRKYPDPRDTITALTKIRKKDTEKLKRKDLKKQTRARLKARVAALNKAIEELGGGKKPVEKEATEAKAAEEERRGAYPETRKAVDKALEDDVLAPEEIDAISRAAGGERMSEGDVAQLLDRIAERRAPVPSERPQVAPEALTPVEPARPTFTPEELTRAGTEAQREVEGFTPSEVVGGAETVPGGRRTALPPPRQAELDALIGDYLSAKDGPAKLRAAQKKGQLTNEDIRYIRRQLGDKAFEISQPIVSEEGGKPPAKGRNMPRRRVERTPEGPYRFQRLHVTPGRPGRVQTEALEAEFYRRIAAAGRTRKPLPPHHPLREEGLWTPQQEHIDIVAQHLREQTGRPTARPPRGPREPEPPLPKRRIPDRGEPSPAEMIARPAAATATRFDEQGQPVGVKAPGALTTVSPQSARPGRGAGRLIAIKRILKRIFTPGDVETKIQQKGERAAIKDLADRGKEELAAEARRINELRDIIDNESLVNTWRTGGATISTRAVFNPRTNKVEMDSILPTLPGSTILVEGRKPIYVPENIDITKVAEGTNLIIEGERIPALQARIVHERAALEQSAFGDPIGPRNIEQILSLLHLGDKGVVTGAHPTTGKEYTGLLKERGKESVTEHGEPLTEITAVELAPDRTHTTTDVMVKTHSLQVAKRLPANLREELETYLSSFSNAGLAALSTAMRPTKSVYGGRPTQADEWVGWRDTINRDLQPMIRSILEQRAAGATPIRSKIPLTEKGQATEDFFKGLDSRIDKWEQIQEATRAYENAFAAHPGKYTPSTKLRPNLEEFFATRVRPFLLSWIDGYAQARAGKGLAEAYAERTLEGRKAADGLTRELLELAPADLKKVAEGTIIQDEAAKLRALKTTPFAEEGAQDAAVHLGDLPRRILEYRTRGSNRADWAETIGQKRQIVSKKEVPVETGFEEARGEPFEGEVEAGRKMTRGPEEGVYTEAEPTATGEAKLRKQAGARQAAEAAKATQVKTSENEFRQLLSAGVEAVQKRIVDKDGLPIIDEPTRQRLLQGVGILAAQQRMMRGTEPVPAKKRTVAPWQMYEPLATRIAGTLRKVLDKHKSTLKNEGIDLAERTRRAEPTSALNVAMGPLTEQMLGPEARRAVKTKAYADIESAARAGAGLGEVYQPGGVEGIDRRYYAKQIRNLARQTTDKALKEKAKNLLAEVSMERPAKGTVGKPGRAKLPRQIERRAQNLISELSTTIKAAGREPKHVPVTDYLPKERTERQPPVPSTRTLRNSVIRSLEKAVRAAERDTRRRPAPQQAKFLEATRDRINELIKATDDLIIERTKLIESLTAELRGKQRIVRGKKQTLRFRKGETKEGRKAREQAAALQMAAVEADYNAKMAQIIQAAEAQGATLSGPMEAHLARVADISLQDRRIAQALRQQQQAEAAKPKLVARKLEKPAPKVEPTTGLSPAPPPGKFVHPSVVKLSHDYINKEGNLVPFFEQSAYAELTTEGLQVKTELAQIAVRRHGTNHHELWRLHKVREFFEGSSPELAAEMARDIAEVRVPAAVVTNLGQVPASKTAITEPWLTDFTEVPDVKHAGRTLDKLLAKYPELDQDLE